MHKKFLVQCLIASFLSFAHANRKCHSLLKNTSIEELADHLTDDATNATIICPGDYAHVFKVICHKSDVGKSYCCYDFLLKFYCCDKDQKKKNVIGLLVVLLVCAGILYAYCHMWYCSRKTVLWYYVDP